MACNLIGSTSLGCRDSNGGISEIKVKVYNSALTGWAETSGTVTASGSALTGWYTYACEKQTASVNNDGAINRLWIAVKDNNGTAWLFGYTRGMDLTAANSTSGTNYEDRSGYTLTFTGMEPEPEMAIANYTALVTA